MKDIKTLFCRCCLHLSSGSLLLLSTCLGGLLSNAFLLLHLPPCHIGLYRGSCCRARLEWDTGVIPWAWLALISVTCPLWFILHPNELLYGLDFNCYFVIAPRVQPSSTPPPDIEGLFPKPAVKLKKSKGKELNFPHQEQERQDNRSQEPPPSTIHKGSRSPPSLLRLPLLLLDHFDQEQLILQQEWRGRDFFFF